jgi:hypothetical protein
MESARPAATARDERGATGPREGPTVGLRPTNIDSTSGRLGEHPSWIVSMFRGDGIGHDGTGWKTFPTKAGRAKMIDSLRRFTEVGLDVLLADTRVDNPTCSVSDDERPGNGLMPLRLTCEEKGLMGSTGDFSDIPIIDASKLVARAPSQRAVAERLGEACRESGFFYVVGHGVDEALQLRLRGLSREFFAQDLETKLRIRMALGGRAWRGYFRVGDELTSGKPDQKEGLYFGAELAADDPRVLAGTPLHGPNLFPAEPEGFREAVLEYMAALTGLGHRLMAGLALSLDLEESYFADRCTGEPFTLFRIFNYPPPADPTLGGVGEHTDYGLLTIL